MKTKFLLYLPIFGLFYFHHLDKCGRWNEFQCCGNWWIVYQIFVIILYIILFIFFSPLISEIIVNFILNLTN